MKTRPPWVTPVIPPLSTRVSTSRMVLRAPRPSDVPELRAHLRRSADHLRPWSPAPLQGDDPASITSLSKTVLRYRREWRRGQGFSFLLLDREEQHRIVGRVNMNAVVRGVFQNAYIGYEIDAQHTGKGLATEAVERALAFAFESAGLHRVQAAIMPRNERSLRVAEKLGFRKEGFAERYLCIAGVWEDHHLFAMTYEDFVARNPAPIA